MTIPLIDISGYRSLHPDARDAVVRAWRDALDTIGFVLITGHGIPNEVAQAAYGKSKEFFVQPEETKLASAVVAWRPTGGAGYVRLFGETVGKANGTSTKADVSESLTFSNPAPRAAGDGKSDNIWPSQPAGFREAIEDYADCAYDLGIELMRISALALDLPEDYFDSVFTPMQHRMRLAYYPEQLTPPEPGQLRNAPHTDFAGFTILLPDDAPGGLQVLTDSEWIDVPVIPGALVINTGDLIQRWTNDRWISNVHRVVNPPLDRIGAADRLSIVFFTAPSMDAEIVCLPTCSAAQRPARYPPVTAAKHIEGKISATFANSMKDKERVSR